MNKTNIEGKINAFFSILECFDHVSLEENDIWKLGNIISSVTFKEL